MNTPQYSEERIQKFIDAWHADFNETISTDEACLQMRTLDKLFHALYDFVIRQAKVSGVSPDEYLNSLPGDKGISGM